MYLSYHILSLVSTGSNKIYLYDDKLTIIFNSGDNPVTINDLLLSEIEDNSKKAEGLFLDGVAPPVIYAYFLIEKYVLKKP